MMENLWEMKSLFQLFIHAHNRTTSFSDESWKALFAGFYESHVMRSDCRSKTTSFVGCRCQNGKQNLGENFVSSWSFSCCLTWYLLGFIGWFCQYLDDFLRSCRWMHKIIVDELNMSGTEMFSIIVAITFLKNFPEKSIINNPYFSMHSTCIKMKLNNRHNKFFELHSFAQSKNCSICFVIIFASGWCRDRRRKSLCDVIRAQKIKCIRRLFVGLAVHILNVFFFCSTLEIGKTSIISQFNLAAFFNYEALFSLLSLFLFSFISSKAVRWSMFSNRQKCHKKRKIYLSCGDLEETIEQKIAQKLETRYFSIKFKKVFFSIFFGEEKSSMRWSKMY